MPPILTLGTFPFSTDTAAFDSLQRSSSWDWAEQKRVGKGPTSHFTGKNAETITLPGTIYPLHKNVGTQQLEKLRTLADKGEPLFLSGGKGHTEGQSFGKWVIKSITEEQSAFLPGGAPRKQTFTISLERYYD